MKKKLSYWGLATIGLILMPMGVLVYAAPANKTVEKKDAPTIKTITGEVVDLWCYLDHKGHGEGHKQCAIICAEAGNPMGIVEKSGQIYILMGAKKHQPGRDVMLKQMAQTVTITGKVIKMGGLQAIYVKKAS